MRHLFRFVNLWKTTILLRKSRGCPGEGSTVNKRSGFQDSVEKTLPRLRGFINERVQRRRGWDRPGDGLERLAKRRRALDEIRLAGHAVPL